MSVKSIAKAWRMPLLKLEAGRIYDKHVGESERNFTNALNMAESMSPAVLWIDEIEKAFGQSESDADSVKAVLTKSFLWICPILKNEVVSGKFI